MTAADSQISDWSCYLTRADQLSSLLLRSLPSPIDFSSFSCSRVFPQVKVLSHSGGAGASVTGGLVVVVVFSCTVVGRLELDVPPQFQSSRFQVEYKDVMADWCRLPND